MERIELEIVAKTDKAKKNIDGLEDSLERLNKTQKDATKEQQSFGDEVASTGGAMALLDAATDGLATRVRDGVEAFRLMRGRLQEVTAAQLKANAAAIANPYVLLATAIVGATVALGKYVEKVTDGVIPTTETLKNAFFSLGNGIRFAQLQADSYAKGLNERYVAESNRAIAVLKAFGENTIDLEIKNAQGRLAALKEGDEQYEATLTELAVLRATKAKQLMDERAAQEEEQRKKDLEAVEARQQKELEIKSKGVEIENATLGKLKQVQNDQEIRQAQNKRQRNLAEEERLAMGKIAIQQNLGAMMANIFGQESKVGKAFAVAQAIRDTYVAANTALASAPPPFNFIAAASTIASGIANVKQIVATEPQVGGGVPNTPSYRGASSQVAVTQAPQISSVGTSGINQLAQTIAGQAQQPVKAYVVSADISTAQSLDRNKIESASI